MKKSYSDGYMRFNVDTLGKPFKKNNSKVKEFPIWRQVVRDAIINKRRINGQIMFITRFYIEDAKGIHTPHFINTAKETI
jgi:hypothetical protein